MQSILARAHKADIRRDPFPHIVIPDALDAELYDRLAREFPATAAVTKGMDLSNAKTGINAVEIVDNPAMSATWQDFAAHHSSPAFFKEVVALFGEEINRLYPFLEADFGLPLDRLRPARRIIEQRKHAHRQDDVVLDCQIMLDDTREERICRGPHVDAVEEIYAGLIYFRHPDDESKGGELCVVRAKNPMEIFPAPDAIRIRHHPAEVDDEDVEIVARVPYAANTAILFINAPNALHKVTMRSATPVPRRHVNIIAESYSLKRGGLFRVLQPGEPVDPPPPPSLVRRALGRVRRMF
jgi:hypothetical protein